MLQCHSVTVLHCQSVTEIVSHFDREVLSSLTTDIEKTVSDEPDCSSPGEDMTESSVELGLLSLQPAVRHHLGPAQDMEGLSQGGGAPAGVVGSHRPLVRGKVGGSEGQPFSAAQPGRAGESHTNCSLHLGPSSNTEAAFISKTER